MMTIQERIIDRLRTNRISSVEVADVLGKKGGITTVEAVNNGHYKAGKVFFAYGYDESNWPIHEQIENISEREVVIIEGINCNDRSLFGDIVSKYMLLYQKAEAVVANGYLRDMHRIIKENYPIWCKGASPVGCFNRKSEEPPSPDVIEKYRKRYEDAIAVCDDSGVCIIRKEEQTEEFLEGLELIELQEDIWYYCIDTLKMSTYETVCLKRYLDEDDLIPPALRKRLKRLQD